MIIRWTIGETSNLGLELLRHSVRQAIKLFPEATRYVCTNSNRKLAVDAIVVQSCPVEGMIGPNSTAWKFYPPRIDINKHELLIDNDIILYQRDEIFDEWLNSDVLLTYESVHMNHGYFKSEYKINSGIIGYPPKFDVKSEIIRVCNEHNISEWRSHFDDQGCWACIAGDLPRFEILQEDIPCLEPYRRYLPGKIGTHFVGANRDEQHFAANKELERLASEPFRPRNF